MKAFNNKKRSLKPVLIIDKLTKDFGKASKRRKKVQDISENEKVLLTMIAKVIVEIIIKEEL